MQVLQAENTTSTANYVLEREVVYERPYGGETPGHDGNSHLDHRPKHHSSEYANTVRVLKVVYTDQSMHNKRDSTYELTCGLPYKLDETTDARPDLAVSWLVILHVFCTVLLTWHQGETLPIWRPVLRLTSSFSRSSLLAAMRRRAAIQTYPIHWQAQYQAVGDNVGDSQSVKHGRAIVAVRLERLHRGPSSPEVGPAAEDVGEEKGDGPDDHNHHQHHVEHPKCRAGKYASVEEQY